MYQPGIELEGANGQKGANFGLKWPIFGAAGAENLEKFGWFSKNSSIFAKNEDFIAWKCIVMHKMSKKDENIA